MIELAQELLRVAYKMRSDLDLVFVLSGDSRAHNDILRDVSKMVAKEAKRAGVEYTIGNRLEGSGQEISIALSDGRNKARALQAIERAAKGIGDEYGARVL